MQMTIWRRTCALIGALARSIGLGHAHGGQSAKQNAGLQSAEEAKASRSLEYMSEIARVVAQGEDLQELAWDEVIIVFGFDEDGSVNETYGYAYEQGGPSHPFALRPRYVRPAVDAYREWLRLERDKGMIKMLFQFNRRSLKVQADFEYDDPSRWKVTPNNIDTIVEELRPRLGDP
ncbi:hypothetical protein [Luteimonas salinilitoris]|uniref:DUF600 family protein n=1 Tax=Luteimonas salinilitoris TaxID=3237697 RepID=A0ABV4HV18_9GAMM